MNMMDGMMGGMWLWMIIGGLILVAIVIAIVKMLKPK